MKPGPEMYFHSATEGQYIYWVNAGNALRWLTGLKEVWSGLQAALLVNEDSKWQVRDDSPSPLMIHDIVRRISVLEALLPIFLHLLSAEQAAGALHNAGE